MKHCTCALLLFMFSLFLGCGGADPAPANLDDPAIQTEIQQHDQNIDAAESAASKS